MPDHPTLLDACLSGHAYMVEICLHRGDHPDQELELDDGSGTTTALHLAFAQENFTMVQCLLDYRADPFAGVPGNYPVGPISCVTAVTTYLASVRRCVSCGIPF
jgi:ankyrin repeat protein